jgi:hypothetical protein
MATGLWVKIIEKLITARIERPDEDADFLPGGDNLLAMELNALEFRRSRVVVAHDKLDLDTRGDVDLAGYKLVVFQDDRKAGIICQGGRCNGENEQAQEPGGTNHYDTPAEMRMRTLLIISERAPGSKHKSWVKESRETDATVENRLETLGRGQDEGSDLPRASGCCRAIGSEDEH